MTHRKLEQLAKMTKYNHNVQTTVTFPDGWLTVLQKIDTEGKRFPLASVHYGRDPITNIPSITVFSDDGHGNGLPILTFPVE